MIKEETKEKTRRKVEHVLRFRRPDSRAHRYDVFVDKYRTVISVLEELAEAFVVVNIVDEGSGFAVEAQDIRYHAIERRSEQVAALCK